MALPQICCRAVVDTHVLRYNICNISFIPQHDLYVYCHRTLVKLSTAYLFVVFVTLFSVCCALYFRLPGKAFQTVFEQHPDSLVRVVQVRPMETLPYFV